MYRITWILLLLCSKAVAQQEISLTPEWKRSFGMRDNTSRDTLTHAAHDRDGNIILAGGTEKDSSFSDILIRKLSPDGELQWSYKYSTGRGVGYDLPLNLFVSRDDEVVVVGYARSTYYHQHAGLYAFKLGKDGNLLWDKEITACTLPGQWFGTDDYHAFLDDESNLYVTFTRHIESEQTNTTYIHAYNPDGVLFQQEAISGVGQSVSGGAFALSTTHDFDGNFVYTIWGDESSPGYYFRRVNPKIATDEITPVSLQFLPDTAVALFHYYFYGTPVKVYHGFNGHTWIVANFGLFGPDQVIVLDVDAADYARYLYVSPKNALLECNNAIYTADNTLLISGTDRSVAGVPRGFIYELNENGAVTRNRNITHPGGFLPYGFEQFDDKYLMSGSVPQAGSAAVKAVSTATLDELWSHETTVPPGELFAGNNALITDPQQVILAGTFRSKKYPQIIPYTEHRWFTESFHPGTGETNWQDSFNGDSTSFASSMHHLIDRNGDLIVLLTENRSPLASLPPYTPTRTTLLKYSKAGEWQWTRPLEPEWISDPGYGTHIIVDQHNNIIIPAVSRETGQYALYRYTSGGDPDKVLYDRQIVRLFCAPDNSINALEVTAQGYQGLVLSGQLEVQTTTPIGGFMLRTFSLPGQQGSYTYTAERVNYAWSDTLVFRLYHNWQLQWEKVIKLGSVYSSGIGNLFDVNPRTGNLVFFSSFTSSLTEQECMRLSLAGELSNLPVLIDYPSVRALVCHQNDQFYLLRNDGVSLYSENGILINDQPMSSPHTLYGFVFKDILFALNNNSSDDWNLSVFDPEGNYRYIFTSDDLGFTWLPSVMDSSYNYYSPTMEGQQISSGAPYAGWQWQRGVISKFGLSELISGISAVEMPGFARETEVSPNPCSSFANISWCAEAPARMVLYNSSGVRVHVCTPGRGAASYQIDMRELPSGIYWLEVQRYSGTVGTLKIVHEQR